jgi:phosphoribosylamine--glycine ligase
MKILVVGSGGREHALAWKLSHSAAVDEVFVAPGNAGTAADEGLTNVEVASDDFEGLAKLVTDRGVDLTVIGPEAPLVDGIVDYFNERDLQCFGPVAAAAQLEGSKAFTKSFLDRFCIPTAASGTFDDLGEAEKYILEQGAPIVVKADGLAAGKGVVVARTVDEALGAVRDMLEGNAFGASGSRVVIEEFLDGEEATFICLCDGETALPFASSQDHKARENGDKGPNTGGMGAYSPAPVITDEIHDRVMRDIVTPTMNGMREMGSPYKGFLYVGLMIMADGTPKVIEFNCRFGDPEAQPVMMRLQSDLADLCQRAVRGDLEGTDLRWDNQVALGVVMAAGGYPIKYDSGDVIHGLADVQSDRIKAFHAGTAQKNGETVTAGGRVLCVVGLGESVTDAQRTAYEGVSLVSWRDEYHRDDIGYRAVAREQA